MNINKMLSACIAVALAVSALLPGCSDRKGKKDSDAYTGTNVEVPAYESSSEPTVVTDLGDAGQNRHEERKKFYKSTDFLEKWADRPMSTDLQLIELVKSRYNIDQVECHDWSGPGTGGMTVQLCGVKADSAMISYTVDSSGRGQLVDFIKTKSPNIPVMDGSLKIGMQWKDFLEITGLEKENPEINYNEAEYACATLDTAEVCFYFAGGALREITWSSTL